MTCEFDLLTVAALVVFAEAEFDACVLSAAWAAEWDASAAKHYLRCHHGRWLGSYAHFR